MAIKDAVAAIHIFPEAVPFSRAAAIGGCPRDIEQRTGYIEGGIYGGVGTGGAYHAAAHDALEEGLLHPLLQAVPPDLNAGADRQGPGAPQGLGVHRHRALKTVGTRIIGFHGKKLVTENCDT